MPRVLVTGPSGCGKSYFADSLYERGFATYDADAVPGLAAWNDDAGHTLAPPNVLDTDFLTTHRFLWDQRVLSVWLSAHPIAVLFGISHNSAEHGPLFDRVALIEAPVDEILRNLADRSRPNAFGHEAEHLRMAHTDTVDYYRRAPTEWLRLPERDPEELMAHLQRVTGHLLRREARDVWSQTSAT